MRDIQPQNNLVSFPQAPASATTGNKLPPQFLTTAVVAECRKSCEDLADTLNTDSISEHDTINDCLAACDEYSTAAARESKHTMRYAIWCAARCEDLLSHCQKIDNPSARSAAKWLKAVTKQMNREVISWQKVKETMNQEVPWDSVKEAMNKEVTWDSVKEAMNKEVISFDLFGVSARLQSS